MMDRPGRLVLLGHPLGHSLSPALQNAALRAAGIALTYEALDVPRSGLDDAVAALRRARGAGNVTIPHKEAMVSRCDRLSAEASAVGAVNTFWTAPDGALVGDNTDVAGFDAAARPILAGVPAAQRVMVFGAGGAASAVLVALKRWGVRELSVYARTMERAERLVARHGMGAAIADPDAPLRAATFVVNATPLGLKGDALPLDPTLLADGCVVLDLAYRTGETPLVHRARERGLRASDGLTMLVEQGALAFERWFGAAPDREAMWRALPERR